jgi:predicted dehydrogenase
VIGIGVIGAGYWGPKHVRNFSSLPDARMWGVADTDQQRLAAIRTQYPHLRLTRDYRKLLESSEVDAVVVATPLRTHARIAREALTLGKHVLVEKPVAASEQEARELLDLARSTGRVLMVGHTFLYHPAVRVLRDIVQHGELGDIYYVHAQRLNLGLFQRDINVVWDLAPHDVAILMYVLAMEPIAATARGYCYVQPGIEDVAHLDLLFPNDVHASIHLSWLDPNKVRRMTIVGSRKMAVYDDVETLEKIRIYDKGVEAPPHTSGFGEFQLSYRYGSITIPHVLSDEPLQIECDHFLQCIKSESVPLTDGCNGLTVVRVLEAAQASLASGGQMRSVLADGAMSSDGYVTATVLR